MSRRVALVALAACLVFGIRQAQTPSAEAKRMSFHNRLLLNRAAVTGLSRIQVMLLTADGQLDATVRRVEEAGGRVRYVDEAVGYLRVEVSIDYLLDLVSRPAVVAYQIASLSRAAWYRDTPPRSNAEMFRELEAAPIGAQPADSLKLPELPVEHSRRPGFTADDDVGLRTWFASHPAFDGRGVTIAFLENAQPEFSHSIFSAAGGPKLAGILNAIDPDDPDDTRVELDTDVRAASTWSSVGGRTYILPRAGTFRFGQFALPAGPGLVHQFGVLRDGATGETWIDANGNGSFQDEAPVADVNTRVEVRTLKLRHPRDSDLSFVVAGSRRPNAVHIYVARGDHQTMTVSVAAGGRTGDGVSYGVAPGARVLLVRTDSAEYRLHHIVEGYLQAAARPDVDIIAAATGFELVPDTDGDFAGLFFTRLVTVWQKPIFQSAGNRQLWAGTANSLGSVFSVGGTLSPESFAAVYGGGSLDGLLVHPSSAAGPALDGRLKPDFLAPTHRIAAGLWRRPRVAVPRNAPTHQLPPGHQISCCTSASSQFAAGIAALLVSGLRQERLSYSYARLSHALRAGSQFLETSPAHHQGNGVVNVNKAWDLLVRPVETPAITSSIDVVHPLAAYAANGEKGVGIFEWTGWTARTTGRRHLRLLRRSGGVEPLIYRVSWLGNDGTFSTAASVTLPLNTPVVLPIDITVRSAGAHSAILNFHDSSGALVFRTQATIVAAELVDPRSQTLRLGGSVPLLRKATHYIAIPEGIESLAIDLEVVRGSAAVNLIPSHGLFPAYQGQIGPQNGRTFTKGRYTVALPRPPAGTWTIDVSNTSIRRERDPSLVSAETVEYDLTVRLQRAALEVRPLGPSVNIDVENRGAGIRKPVVLTSPAIVRTQDARFPASGLPTVFPIDVPKGASTLIVEARGSSTLEIYLYDCSSGECFSHNYTIPPALRQRLIVRRPSAGRWIAAVNASPFFGAEGTFSIEHTIAGQAQRWSAAASTLRGVGERWTETIDLAASPMLPSGGSRVVLCEIVDGELERDEAERLWEVRDNFPRLPHSPVAAGSAIARLQ